METSFEVEQFLLGSEVDASAASALRECTPEVQRAVIGRGDLSTARNPSAALFTRIKAAVQEGAAASGAEGAELAVQVEAFAASNGLDEASMQMLRSCDAVTQKQVLARGDLSSARNKAAVLQARIKNAQGLGGCNEGWMTAGAPASGLNAGGWGKGGGGGWGGMPGPSDWTTGWGPPAGGMGWGAPAAPSWGAPAPQLWGTPATPSWARGAAQPYGAQQPDVLWLGAMEGSKIAAEGLMLEAPAVTYDKSQAVFQSAANMLADLVGDISTAVVIQHDPDWQEFPDIGQALAQACGEENCFAVAKCAQHGKWAVGAAPGWKGRESAVKLALCVALTAGTPMLENLARTYPEFRAMVQAAGLMPPPGGMGCKGGGPPAWAGGPPMGATRAGRSSAAYSPEAFPPDAPAWGAPAWQEPAWGGAPAGPGPMGPPMPAVHWLMLAPDAPLVKQGFPGDAPVITHDKAFADYFRNAHSILSDLLGEVNDVEMLHDPDWLQFPEVAEAAKQAGAEENCIVVVTSPSRRKWAVGMGGGWKPRESSGKLSMCLSLAMAMTPEELGNVMNQYPEFGELCSAAGFMDAGPAQKKRRLGGGF